MSGMFFDTTMLALEKTLNVSSLRQKVIAHNIANVNTPGFKRSYVAFEEELQQALGKQNKLALRRTHGRHFGQVGDLGQVTASVRQDHSSSMRADGNNVDIDLENAELAMNSIMYNAVSDRLNGKFQLLSYVINGGR